MSDNTNGVIDKKGTWKEVIFSSRGDARGQLMALEGNVDVPFDIKRVYYIFATKEDVHRGFHAHKNLSQLLIAVSGSCKVIVDDGEQKSSIILDSPTGGLLIKDLIWREMYDFTEDCVLLVLASEHYDESDYIRDYEEFKAYLLQ